MLYVSPRHLLFFSPLYFLVLSILSHYHYLSPGVLKLTALAWSSTGALFWPNLRFTTTAGVWDTQGSNSDSLNLSFNQLSGSSDSSPQCLSAGPNSSYLVHLSIGPISHHLHQLKDPCWVLEERVIDSLRLVALWQTETRTPGQTDWETRCRDRHGTFK